MPEKKKSIQEIAEMFGGLCVHKKETQSNKTRAPILGSRARRKKKPSKTALKASKVKVTKTPQTPQASLPQIVEEKEENILENIQKYIDEKILIACDEYKYCTGYPHKKETKPNKARAPMFSIARKKKTSKTASKATNVKAIEEKEEKLELSNIKYISQCNIENILQKTQVSKSIAPCDGRSVSLPQIKEIEEIEEIEGKSSNIKINRDRMTVRVNELKELNIELENEPFAQRYISQGKVENILENIQECIGDTNILCESLKVIISCSKVAIAGVFDIFNKLGVVECTVKCMNVHPNNGLLTLQILAQHSGPLVAESLCQAPILQSAVKASKTASKVNELSNTKEISQGGNNNHNNNNQRPNKDDDGDFIIRVQDSPQPLSIEPPLFQAFKKKRISSGNNVIGQLSLNIKPRKKLLTIACWCGELSEFGKENQLNKFDFKMDDYITNINIIQVLSYRIVFHRDGYGNLFLSRMITSKFVIDIFQQYSRTYTDATNGN